MHKSKGRDIVNVVVDDHPQALGTVVLGHFLEAEGFGHPRTSPFSHGKLGLPHCGGSQINLEPWKSCAFHVQIQSVMLFQDFRKWTSTTTANETTITTSSHQHYQNPQIWHGGHPFRPSRRGKPRISGSRPPGLRWNRWQKLSRSGLWTSVLPCQRWPRHANPCKCQRKNALNPLISGKL